MPTSSFLQYLEKGCIGFFVAGVLSSDFSDFMSSKFIFSCFLTYRNLLLIFLITSSLKSWCYKVLVQCITARDWILPMVAWIYHVIIDIIIYLRLLGKHFSTFKTRSPSLNSNRTDRMNTFRISYVVRAYWAINYMS